MPALTRNRTKYPGVYYIQRKMAGSRKREKIYYIVYRKGGKQIEEKTGRQFQDSMTAAKAARIRAECIAGIRMPGAVIATAFTFSGLGVPISVSSLVIVDSKHPSPSPFREHGRGEEEV